MLPRQRVFAALNFEPPDVVPLEYHPSPSGFYEHGERLRQLWAQLPDDFGSPGRFEIVRPAPEHVDAEGRYSEIRGDEWGVVRQYLIFGATGFPVLRPLDDWAGFQAFHPPLVPPTAGPEFTIECDRAREHRQRYFLKSGWISLFESMHALRRFEDVLIDLGNDAPEIHRLADQLTEYYAGQIRYFIARGVDAIQFGDDFGTQSGLILSPRVWRRFFKPRYELLIRAVRDAGKKVFFHSCGCIRPLLDDLADLRVDAIWPQLNAYDELELVRFCAQNRIAAALHPDRGGMMIDSDPKEVCRYVHRLAENFSIDCGGAWLYVEIDHGFPFENIVALMEAIASLRKACQGIAVG
jgi:hypothetical protein